MKCDFCGEKAVANYQKAWTRFQIDGDEFIKDKEFSPLDIEEPTESDNLIVCATHEEAFKNGEI